MRIRLSTCGCFSFDCGDIRDQCNLGFTLDHSLKSQAVMVRKAWQIEAAGHVVSAGRKQRVMNTQCSDHFPM